VAALSMLAPACVGASGEPSEESADDESAIGVCKELEGKPGDQDRVSLDEEEAAFQERINRYRRDNQLPELAACRSLHRAAQAHSEQMRDGGYFSHTDPGGATPPDRACDACYNGGCFENGAIGENIAAGYTGGLDTFEQWRASPGHNANMLGTAYRVIGIGRALGGEYGAHWTTVFGSEVERSCDDP